MARLCSQACILSVSAVGSGVAQLGKCDDTILCRRCRVRWRLGAFAVRAVHCNLADGNEVAMKVTAELCLGFQLAYELLVSMGESLGQCPEDFRGGLICRLIPSGRPSFHLKLQ